MSAAVTEVLNLIYNDGTEATPCWNSYPVMAELDGVYMHLSFRYHAGLKDEIKALAGARWNNERKVWSIADSQHNRFQLAFLQGQNPYEWWEQPLQEFQYTRPLWDNQRSLANHGLTYRAQIWAAEMACVDGDAIIGVSREGRETNMIIRSLHHHFHGGRYWDNTIPTFIRGQVGSSQPGLIKILDTVFKGKKKTIRFTTLRGNTLAVTPDHELCVGGDQYLPAEQLKVGAHLITHSVDGLTADTITHVEDGREIDVYDIQCEGPAHNFLANNVVVHNCGKSLAAIEVLEKSGYQDWWWVSQGSALKAVNREFAKWNLQFQPRMLTYQGLVSTVKNWQSGDPAPRGIIFDESHNIKTASSQRTRAAIYVADQMRAAYERECFVICMTGTPAPKCPTDWWAQARVVAPGFLREGEAKSFERRLRHFIFTRDAIGQEFWRAGSWKDDEAKCSECGLYEPEHPPTHKFKRGVNEVAGLNDRLNGLVIKQFKKDVLDLPEKVFRFIRCQPSPSIRRAAQVIARGAPNAITGVTLLRELSDGFQYTDKIIGKQGCTHCKGSRQIPEWYDPENETRAFNQLNFLDAEYAATLRERQVDCPFCKGTGEINEVERIASMVPTPKDTALKDLLEENSEIGRLVVYAGFTGSIDRCVQVAHREGWTVVRVDGRGWEVTDCDGNVITDREALDLWSDLSDTPLNRKVVFIAHPASGGVGLTLIESQMIVFYSMDWNPAAYLQASDRTHRFGNKSTTICLLFHLASDEHVFNVLSDNRRLELSTLGEIQAALETNPDSYDY